MAAPDALWLGSEVGDWWSTNDLASMFQDAAGTIPVTAAGQTVVRWIGQKGGTALVLRTAYGPTLRANGSNFYLEFTSGGGVNQALWIESIQIADPVTGVWTLAGGFAIPAANATTYEIWMDNGGTARVGGLRTISSQAQAWGAGSGFVFDPSGTAPAGSYTPYTHIGVRTETHVESFYNNTSNGPSAVAGSPVTVPGPLNLNTNTGSTYSNYNIHAGIVAIGRAITSNERDALHTWIAAGGPLDSGGTTHEGAASLTGAGTATGTARRAAKGSAAVSGTGTLTATSKLWRKGAGVLNGTSTLAATVKLNRRGAAALSGAGELEATAKAARNAAALLAGTSTLTATATTSSGQQGTASLTGAGTMSAAATLSAGAAASLTGTGAVSGAARAVRGASATLMGQGALNALARLETNAAAVLAGVGTMTAVGRSEAPRRATTSLRTASHAQRPRQVSIGSRPAAVSMGRR